MKVCLEMSSLKPKTIFVSLSLAQHHFIISVFCKRDISVPCFMVAVIHKNTTWIFQEKNALFFPEVTLRCVSSLHSWKLSFPCWWASSEIYNEIERDKRKKELVPAHAFIAFIELQFKHSTFKHISLGVMSLFPSTDKWDYKINNLQLLWCQKALQNVLF